MDAIVWRSVGDVVYRAVVQITDESHAHESVEWWNPHRECIHSKMFRPSHLGRARRNLSLLRDYAVLMLGSVIREDKQRADIS